MNRLVDAGTNTECSHACHQCSASSSHPSYLQEHESCQHLNLNPSTSRTDNAEIQIQLDQSSPRLMNLAFPLPAHAQTQPIVTIAIQTPISIAHPTGGISNAVDYSIRGKCLYIAKWTPNFLLQSYILPSRLSY